LSSDNSAREAEEFLLLEAVYRERHSEVEKGFVGAVEIYELWGNQR
jgi:hypothetical protein